MDEIWALLETMTYPAGKEDILGFATAANAPDDVMKRLEALPQRQYENEDALSRALVRRRAESNPSMVAITVEVCEECGFARAPGEPHSCIEEKARFAESVHKITDEFQTLDDGREA